MCSSSLGCVYCVCVCRKQHLQAAICGPLPLAAPSNTKAASEDILARAYDESQFFSSRTLATSPDLRRRHRTLNWGGGRLLCLYFFSQSQGRWLERQVGWLAQRNSKLNFFLSLSASLTAGTAQGQGSRWESIYKMWLTYAAS